MNPILDLKTKRSLEEEIINFEESVERLDRTRNDDFNMALKLYIGNPEKYEVKFLNSSPLSDRCDLSIPQKYLIVYFFLSRYEAKSKSMELSFIDQQILELEKHYRKEDLRN